MHLQDGVGHGWEQSFTFQDVDVPDPEGEGERSLHEQSRSHDHLAPLEEVRRREVLTLSRKHWKNHFMVYRLVNTSCLSCSSTNTRQHIVMVTTTFTAALAAHQVLLQLGQVLRQDAVVVLLEADQLGETGDEEPWRRQEETGGGQAERQLLGTCWGWGEGRVLLRGPTVHGVLVSRQQLDQSPEGVLLVHVDEQQRRDLTHALAVAHLLQQEQTQRSAPQPSAQRNSPCCTWSRP